MQKRRFFANLRLGPHANVNVDTNIKPYVKLIVFQPPVVNIKVIGVLRNISHVASKR